MSETRTVLERQLAGDGNGSNVTAMDAFRAARRKFLHGERIDMQELAAELGVGRATLYRWVGSREQLLGEVLWSLTEATFERLKGDANRLHGGNGVDWFLYIYEQFGIYTVGFDALRTWIDSEPELAMRVMTSKHAQQQRRVIGAYEELLREAIDHHGLKVKPKLELHTLAYVLVRIGESFLWTDLITGEEPNLREAWEVARALLA
jgi:AcrR family transcriptional regulator